MFACIIVLSKNVQICLVFRRNIYKYEKIFWIPIIVLILIIIRPVIGNVINFGQLFCYDDPHGLLSEFQMIAFDSAFEGFIKMIQLGWWNC